MKSKTKQYLLLVLVAIIWGFIIVRFFSGREGHQAVIPPIKISEAKRNATENGNSYVYHLNYADPFLKVYEPRQPEPEAVQSKPVPPKKIYLPALQLLGIVSSSQKNTGLLMISGRSYMVNAGDEIQGFKVRQVDAGGLSISHMESDSTFNMTAGIVSPEDRTASN